MQILDGLLSEQEVLDMPDETLEAYVSVFDQLLYDGLGDYINSPTANTEVVNKLQSVVGTAITRYTFHTQVNSKGIKEDVWDNRLVTMPEKVYNGEIDLDAMIEKLEWLLDNSQRLTATLPIRTKDMYKKALALTTEYEKDTTKAHDNPISEMLVLYKDKLFCPRQTKPVKTGMSGLMLNKSRWTMQLRAAQYLKLCCEQGISQMIAKEV